MEKDLFVIAGMVEDIKKKAIQLDKILMSGSDDDIDFEELETLALDINDTSDNLIGEINCEY